MTNLAPKLEDARSFWPHENAGGIAVTSLLAEVQQFALTTFDRLDSNGNGFISREELEAAKSRKDLSPREFSYIRFLCHNVDRIGAAHDDGDNLHPEGISRNDILVGISRKDLITFFGVMGAST